MNKLSTLFIVFMLITPLFVAGQSTEYKATAVNIAATDALDARFRSYHLFEIETKAIQQIIESQGRQPVLTLQLPDLATLPLQLIERNILTDDYQLIVAGKDGRSTYGKPAMSTFGGYVSGASGSQVALSLSANVLLGSILSENNNAYYIEPLRYLTPGAPDDVYIVYQAADVIIKPGNHCAATDVASHTPATDPLNGQKETGTATGNCKMVEMAIASDSTMLVRYGTAYEVQQHNIAVTNMMVGTYTNIQLGPDFLEFKIKGQYVATNAATSPTQPLFHGAGADTSLPRFATWGNAGNFGFTYDLGQMWTAQDMTYTNNTSVVGLAYVGTVCNSSRYQVIESGLPVFMEASIVSHETGHNLSANHDASGAPYIMAPSLSNPPNLTFSPASTTSITNYLAQPSVNCLAACNAALPVAEFDPANNVICTGSTVAFTDYSVGQVTSRSWSFTGGSITSSTSATPSVTYATAGVKTVSLTVTNAAGTHTRTKNLLVSAAPATACAAGNTNCQYTGLRSVQLLNLSYSISSVPVNGVYVNAICNSAIPILQPNTTYTMKYVLGFPGYASDKAALYIDYNDDGDFVDADEVVYLGTNCILGAESFSFTTPAAPPVMDQLLRMRVVSRGCSNMSTAGCNIGCGSIYDFGVVMRTLVPLPLQLLSFTGQRVQGANQLQWELAPTETFTAVQLERSSDGQHYTDIATIPVNVATKAYRYTDAVPAAATPFFYRLRLNGAAGQASYSQVIRIDQPDDNGNLSAYPNPVSAGGKLYIAGSTGTGVANLQIINPLGQLMYQNAVPQAAQQALQIPASWQPGLYLLRITDEGSTKSLKLLIQ